MTPDWLEDDPFVDKDDPASIERAERRREREQRRQAKAPKSDPTPAAAPPAEPTPPPAPPTPKRTPEQDFWDEDPTPEPTPAPPLPSDSSEKGETGESSQTGGFRSLLRRKRKEEPAADAPNPPASKPEGDVPQPAAPKPDPEAPAPVVSAGSADPGVPSPGTPREVAPGEGTPGSAPTSAPTLDPNAPTPGTTSPGPITQDDLLAAPGPRTREESAIAAASAAAAQRASTQTSEEWATAPGPEAEGDWDFHEEGDPEMTGAARTGRRHGDDGGRRGILGALLRHPFRILAVILLIVLLWFLNALFQPFHGDGSGHVAVTIPKGSSVSEVGDLLSKRGVIDDSTMFQIRVTLAGKRSDLFAGRFNLKHEMSYGAAIDALSKEPNKAQKPGITTVTLPEGYDREQMGQLVREDGVPGNYMKATVKSKYLSPAEYGGKGAKGLEGFLFPDTFELKPKAPVADLVQLQLQDFKRKIKQVNMKYAKSKNLTVFDVLTIASMVEREAGVPKQRKLVASVIYNRLREGIPLGIDATIRFATGNYEEPLTQTQLETNSPYNTRTNQGLPPGPINSPGLAAIEAAAHPANTEFIYYVNDPNSCNELTFAKTEEEFNEAVEKYETAREKNGGNAPSTCGN